MRTCELLSWVLSLEDIMHLHVSFEVPSPPHTEPQKHQSSLPLPYSSHKTSLPLVHCPWTTQQARPSQLRGTETTQAQCCCGLVLRKPGRSCMGLNI